MSIINWKPTIFGSKNKEQIHKLYQLLLVDFKKRKVELEENDDYAYIKGDFLYVQTRGIELIKEHGFTDIEMGTTEQDYLRPIEGVSDQNTI